QAGELFADHTVGNIGNMDDGMSFLYALPTAAASAYNSSSLEYGEQFTLNGLTYEVCGYNSVSVIGSSSVSGAVVLADGVTYGEREYMLAQIGSEAFKNNRRITSLTIPQSVTVIYNFAFYGCTLLNNITLADTSGWRRIPNDGETTVYEQIDESSLQSASSAATLLKQTYDVGLTKYQYTWVKAPSA
ncbi:MAG: leucine-rich repeat protein, partial [Candidatus Coproplasma sp.]